MWRMSDYTSDVKAIVRVLAHHEVDYLLSSTTAESLGNLASNVDWRGPPTTISPSADPDSLSQLADALFSLGSRRAATPSTVAGDGSAWSPWPSTVENLCGTYDTDLGRLVVDQPRAEDQFLWAVVVNIAGHDVRIPRRGAARLSPRTSVLLSEPL